MKKIMIIVIFLIYTVIAMATPIERFTQKLDENTLINRHFPIKSFDNFENNASVKEIKENLEALLALYLSAKDLFSPEEIKFFNIEGSLVQTDSDKEVYITSPERDAVYYMDFFNLLFVYLEENSNSQNKQLIYALSDKALYDVTQLMANSSSVLEYIVSLELLEKFYKRIDDCVLLKKYPPLDKEIIFTRLEQDKEATINLIKGNVQGVFEDNRTTRFSKNLTQEFYDITEKKLEVVYRKMTVIIKDPSPKKIKEYDDYCKSVKYDFDDTFSKFELFIFDINQKILETLHSWDIDIGYYFGFPERASKILMSATLTNVEPMIEFYEKHEELIKQYEDKIEGCFTKNFTRALETHEINDTIEELYGKGIVLEESNEIEVTVPTLIANGYFTPVKIKTKLPLKSIAIMQERKGSKSLMAFIKVPQGSEVNYEIKLNYGTSSSLVKTTFIFEGLNGKYYVYSKELEVVSTCCDDELMDCHSTHSSFKTNPKHYIENLEFKYIVSSHKVKFQLQTNMINEKESIQYKKPVQYMTYFQAKTESRILFEIYTSLYTSSIFSIGFYDYRLKDGEKMDITIEDNRKNTSIIQKIIEANE